MAQLLIVKKTPVKHNYRDVKIFVTGLVVGVVIGGFLRLLFTWMQIG